MSLTKATYSMIDGAPVNVLDYGADPTGVADSQAAIQAAINAGNGRTVILPKGVYKLTAQLLLENHKGTQIVSETDNGESLPAKLQCAGTFDNALQIRDSREIVFSGIGVSVASGAVQNGFNVNQSAAPTTVCTNIKFIDCAVQGVAANGWYFTSLSGNTDLIELHNCYATDLVNGVYIDNSQTKMLKVIGGAYTGCTTGINCKTGAFHALHTGFGGNTQDIYLDVPNNAITIIGCQSELSEKFLQDSGASGDAWPVSVIGCRLAMQVPMTVTGIYINYQKRGPFNLIGNQFDSGNTVVSNFRVLVGGNTEKCPFNSIGNYYPFSDPFNGVGFNTLTQLGDNYELGSGNGAAPFEATISSANVADGVGFFGAALTTTKPTITGSKGGNAALGSLITALANYGLITDSTS